MTRWVLGDWVPTARDGVRLFSFWLSCKNPLGIRLNLIRVESPQKTRFTESLSSYYLMSIH